MTGLPRRLTVIAPHPDDETLGAGGSIARFAAQGVEVSVLVVSGHLPPLYPQEAFDVTRREAEAAKNEAVRRLKEMTRGGIVEVLQ